MQPLQTPVSKQTPHFSLHATNSWDRGSKATFVSQANSCNSTQKLTAHLASRIPRPISTIHNQSRARLAADREASLLLLLPHHSLPLSSLLYSKHVCWMACSCTKSATSHYLNQLPTPKTAAVSPLDGELLPTQLPFPPAFLLLLPHPFSPLSSVLSAGWCEAESAVLGCLRHQLTAASTDPAGC